VTLLALKSAVLIDTRKRREAGLSGGSYRDCLGIRVASDLLNPLIKSSTFGKNFSTARIIWGNRFGGFGVDGFPGIFVDILGEARGSKGHWFSPCQALTHVLGPYQFFLGARGRIGCSRCRGGERRERRGERRGSLGQGRLVGAPASRGVERIPLPGSGLKLIDPCALLVSWPQRSLSSCGFWRPVPACPPCDERDI